MAGRSEFSIQSTPSAKHDLARLSPEVQRRISRSIDRLAVEPRPSGSKLLSGNARRIWRIRVGDYRVLYEIHDDQLVVLVIRVGHRREIYR